MIGARTIQSIMLALALGAASGCDIDQVDEGRAPAIDVEYREGELPDYDVDVAMVEVRAQERTVEVPDVDVSVMTETTMVTVPDVDVEMPE